MRELIEHRVVLSLACSLLVGTAGLHVWPFPAHDPLLQLVAYERPSPYQSVIYAYNTLWFSTPVLLLNVVASLVYIFAARLDRPATPQPRPPYPDPCRRTDLFLILGEQHHRTVSGRASHPHWLAIPERGLYTGTVIVGAVGSGKTSACMYPYVEQLLAFRADEPAHKLVGLIPEVKGEFCVAGDEISMESTQPPWRGHSPDQDRLHVLGRVKTRRDAPPRRAG
jgi:hypothetical protein